MTTRLPPHLEPLRRIARRVPGGMALGRAVRRLFDPELREIHRLEHKEAGLVFQPYPTTSEDRYPELFDALGEILGALEAPRILSFGCANGAEVRALRRRLPQAQITGIDLNRRAIEAARRQDRSPLSRYLLAGASPPEEEFDAVLALAVFRHGRLEAERPDSCAAILPFARFAEGLSMLDRALVQGGWLALGNAHFRLEDTDLAARYDPDPRPFGVKPPPDLYYGPDNRRIDGTIEGPVLFRKVG